MFVPRSTLHCMHLCCYFHFTRYTLTHTHTRTHTSRLCKLALLSRASHFHFCCALKFGFYGVLFCVLRFRRLYITCNGNRVRTVPVELCVHSAQCARDDVRTSRISLFSRDFVHENGIHVNLHNFLCSTFSLYSFKQAKVAAQFALLFSDVSFLKICESDSRNKTTRRVD